MSAYQYQAVNRAGKTKKGIIEADSERQARLFLRDNELTPLEISIVTRKVAHKTLKISTTERALLTRQLATLLSAGIPVEEALNGVIEQSEKPSVSEVIIGVRSKVLEGYSLAQAMDEFPNTFPELYRATVAAGEQTGRLDLILDKLADYSENQQAIRQKIQQALIYPILMIVISTSIISFLLVFVIPKIIEVFINSGQSLPMMTEVLIRISSSARAYGVYFLLFFTLLFFGFKRSLGYSKFKTRWHSFLLQLPIAKYLIKTTDVARYIHTFSILFAAGVPVLESMRVSAGVVTNVIIRQAFTQSALHVKEGKGISNALKSSHFLSPMTLHLISSGEKSGQLAEMMQRAASHLDNEIKRLIDTALSLLEPIIILLMGVVVLFIVLATLLPIFSMEQLVN